MMMMMMKKEGSLLRITIVVTLTLLFCFLTADSEVRCIESERHALLNFKQHLEDPSNRLASWTAAAASDGDCCDWIGVVCDNRTGHVLQLHITTIYPLDDELTDDAQRRAQYEAYERSRFGGEIPKEVASLQGLQSLNFSFNILTGRIPENIGDMRSLESIDFSINQLSGKIPQSMSSLTFLSQLNLSNNKLIGRIPSSTQLQSLNASSFFGNKLCGPPLTDNCTIHYVKPNIENKWGKDFGGQMVDWFFVSMALGFVVGFWVVVGPLLWNKQWRILYFQFLDHLGYKLGGVVTQTW